MRRWLTFLLLWCLGGMVLAAPVPSATLDRDRIALGGSVTLRIEAGRAGSPPELAALRADFRVLSHRQERRSMVRDGRFIAEVTHLLVLQPRHAGRLRIPPLRVAGGTTPALVLQVEGPSAPEAPGAAAGLVEARLGSPAAWVGQPVLLEVTVRLPPDIGSGELAQDPPPGASLQRLGQDGSRQVLQDGEPWLQVVRRFLVVPEREGELRLPPARLAGQRQSGLWLGGGEPVEAAGPALSLPVRALPAAADTPWRPLHDLRLSWSATPAAVVAGQGARFELEAVLDGGTPALRDSLVLPGAGPGWRLYAEPVRSEEKIVDARPVLVLRRAVVLVPERAGPLSLPPLELPWWEPASGRRRVARLDWPALEVAPGGAGEEPAPVAAPDGGTLPAAATGATGRNAVAGWRVVTVLAGLALAAAGGGWWWRRRRQRQAPGPAPDAVGPDAGLATALAGGSVQDVIDVLCGARGLSGRAALLAALADPGQRQALLAAERAWWGPGGDRVAARAALRRAFAGGPRWRPGTPPAPPDALPPLYHHDL